MNKKLISAVTSLLLLLVMASAAYKLLGGVKVLEQRAIEIETLTRGQEQRWEFMTNLAEGYGTLTTQMRLVLQGSLLTVRDIGALQQRIVSLEERTPLKAQLFSPTNDLRFHLWTNIVVQTNNLIPLRDLVYRYPGTNLFVASNLLFQSTAPDHSQRQSVTHTR